MQLYDVPLVFAMIGLALYTVLGGADFGAGMHELTAGRGARGEALREVAHDAMAPVWEANHVWLVFVLTVVWTAYPTAFGSMASTLSVPLFIAAIGVILRGTAYALRSGAQRRREVHRIDLLFAASSLLTPFAMGTMVGGIASGRVPVGNAAGNLITSWVNPLSLLVGVLAVATSAYLAAVFLAADVERQGDAQMLSRLRARAVLAACVAGVVAIAGLFVLRSDTPRLYDGLTSGAGLVALVVSMASGLATLALVLRGRFQLARASAALAVAAIIAGWAAAQQPLFLPGLTIQRAAAPHDTLVVVIASVLIGAVLLFPSLGLLFALHLRGRFDPHAAHPNAPVQPRSVLRASSTGLLTRSAGGLAIAGFGLLTVANAGWMHAIGVVCFFAFVVVGFLAVAPAQLAAD